MPPIERKPQALEVVLLQCRFLCVSIGVSVMAMQTLVMSMMEQAAHVKTTRKHHPVLAAHRMIARSVTDNRYLLVVLVCFTLLIMFTFNFNEI